MKQPNQHSLLTHVPIAMVSPQGGASCGANTSALLFSKVVCTLAAVQCFSSPAPTELWGRCCEACNHHPLTALHSSSLWANSTWGIRGHLTCRPPKPALPAKPASLLGILAMSAQRTTHNMSQHQLPLQRPTGGLFWPWQAWGKTGQWDIGLASVPGAAAQFPPPGPQPPSASLG